MRNKKSSAETALLTKHKHIDTTVNHYLDSKLEKMLEATYKVKLGKDKVNAENKVIGKIPDEFKGANSDVESGCGKCTAKHCNGVAALSCLACEYFITTPEHRPYFEKAIEMIQCHIRSTENRHEKEDLVTRKTLYVQYLKAIYKHQEKNNET